MGFIQDLFIRIKGDSSSLTKEINKSTKGINNLKGTLKKLAKVTGLAFAAKKLVNFGAEAVNLAIKIGGVRTAFDRMVVPGTLDMLRRATRGAVDDMVLMQKTVQASNFGIPVEKLGKLFEFASARAIQTGESVEYLTESIITGIGRKSPLILDNLGISASRLKEAIDKVGGSMNNVGDVTRAIGLIMEEELGKMGDIADDTATKVAKLKANWKNFKTAIGEKFINSPIVKGVSNYVGDVGELAKIMTQFNLIQVASFRLFTPRLAKEVIEEMKEVNRLTDEHINKLNAEKNVRVVNLAALKEENKLKKISIPGTPSLTALNTPEASIPQQLFKNLGADISGGLVANKFDVKSQTKEFADMQIAIMNLSDTFSRFFSDVNLGFQGMVQGVITGLKRLVMELAAKAAILSVLSLITGVPLSGKMFGQLLFGSDVGTLVKGGALGNMGMFSGGMNINVTGKLSGKDILLSANRTLNE